MKTILKLLTAPLALLLAFSCVWEEMIEPDTGGGQEPMTIRLTVPDNMIPTTRGKTEDEQRQIIEFSVLVFDASTSPEILLANLVYGFPLPGITELTFTTDQLLGPTEVLAGLENFRLVVTANWLAEASFLSLPNRGIGMEKQELLEWLIFNDGGVDGKGRWRGVFPMYGESEVIPHTQSTVADVSLTRALARIDVEVLPAVQDDFVLQNIHLVNTNGLGYVAPAWDPADGTILSPAVPQMPNVPENSYYNPRLWKKDGDEMTYPASISGLVAEIFTYESMAAYDADEDPTTPNPAASPEAMCLILEGLYDGNRSFYRVDFTYGTTDPATGAVKGNYMPILRNHKYKISVEAALGQGYATIGEAIASFGVESNLKTRILNYDLTEINQMVFNEQYMLGVGTTEYESETSSVLPIDREAGSYSLKVFTDNPGGWKATVGSSAASWLWIAAAPPASAVWDSTAASSVSEAVSDLSVLVLNNAGGPRRGEILLTAGRLTYTVAIQQSSDTDVEIRIIDASNQDINSLSFGYDSPEAQRFYVLWSPSNVPVTVTSRVIGTKPSGFENDGNFAEANVPQATVHGGGEMFNMCPPMRSVVDEGGDYSTEYTFTVSWAGSIFSKSIRVSQLVPQRMPKANSYIVAPAWENGDAYPIMIPVSRANEFPGNTLNGTNYQIVQGDNYVAELIWTDIPGGVNPDQSTAIAEIVPLKMGNAQAIDDCFIKVTPGKMEGNAVIAVRKNSGSPHILWSWHVWVTRYNPGAGITGSFENGVRLDPTPIPAGSWINEEGMYGRVYGYNTGAANAYSYNIFMDRNLGAAGVSISATGDINRSSDAQKLATYGLLYQWGRKDPFPGSSSATAATQKAVYNANGAAVTFTKVVAQPTTGTYNNLNNFISEANRNSFSVVRQPTRIYYQAGVNTATSKSFDWYSSVYNIIGNTSNNTLWGNGGAKTIYDPCPPGWRVPESGQARGNNLLSTTTLYNYIQTNSPWYGLSGMATPFDNGYFWENMGWYPAAGYYGSGDSQLTRTGQQGLYWSAGAPGSSFPAGNREGTAAETYHQQYRSHLANMLNIANGQEYNEPGVSVFDLMEAGRVRALSVRCVVDM